MRPPAYVRPTPANLELLGPPVEADGRRDEPPHTSRSWLGPWDAVLALALGLWVLAIETTNAAPITDYGLLSTLTVPFYLGVGLLAVSAIAQLTRPHLSTPRLSLHLVALVLMLHGVTPLVFGQPQPAWLYKHVGVAQYIALHGSVNTSIDIYQNWPGFFAVVAWFDQLAGISTPLAYAGWAPVYFNLLTVLALAFALRGLTSSARRRWLTLFFFVAANWVGQDYFSPQAFAFVLSLIVTGLVLRWFRSQPSLRFISLRAFAWLRRLYLEPSGDMLTESPRLERWSRALLLVALNLVFAAVVISHQLSPFVVLVGMVGLAAVGLARPWWITVCPAVLAFGYLGSRLGAVTEHYSILTSLNPIANLLYRPVPAGQRLGGPLLAGYASWILSLGLWLLAVVGIFRRVREGSPVLSSLTLMIAPMTLALGSNYGGEASLRVFLFSLPWTALLVASALVPVGRMAVRHALAAGAALLTVLTLFMFASLGLTGVQHVSPQEAQASQYLDDHARRGSVLVLTAPIFPERVGARYDAIPSTVNLPDEPGITHQTFDTTYVQTLETNSPQHVQPSSQGALYVAFSKEQNEFDHTYGLLPDGSLDQLRTSLDYSPGWSVFYQNQDTVIYQYVPQPSSSVKSGS